MEDTGSLRTAGSGSCRPAAWAALPGTHVLVVRKAELSVSSRRLRESPSSPSAMPAALIARRPERSSPGEPPQSWPCEQQAAGPETLGTWVGRQRRSRRVPVQSGAFPACARRGVRAVDVVMSARPVGFPHSGRPHVGAAFAGGWATREARRSSEPGRRTVSGIGGPARPHQYFLLFLYAYLPLIERINISAELFKIPFSFFLFFFNLFSN